MEIIGPSLWAGATEWRMNMVDEGLVIGEVYEAQPGHSAFVCHLTQFSGTSLILYAQDFLGTRRGKLERGQRADRR